MVKRSRPDSSEYELLVRAKLKKLERKLFRARREHRETTPPRVPPPPPNPPSPPLPPPPPRAPQPTAHTPRRRPAALYFDPEADSDSNSSSSESSSDSSSSSRSSVNSRGHISEERPQPPLDTRVLAEQPSTSAGSYPPRWRDPTPLLPPSPHSHPPPPPPSPLPPPPPSSPPVLEESIPVEPPNAPELDGELLEILGADPSLAKVYGKDIQADLAKRLQHVATNGLTKEVRKELIDIIWNTYHLANAH